MTRQIGLFTGSLREGSFTRRIGRAMAAMLPEGYEVREIAMGDLPLYNEDLEADPPASWVAFRDEVASLDACLFITPEYNRSLPAVLKNALDVGSRPYGEGVWIGKPAGVVSGSMGSLGGFGAHHHLRQVLTCLDMPVLQQPEMYLPGIHEMIDADGKVINPDTENFFKLFLEAYIEFVEMHLEAEENRTPDEVEA